MKNKIILVLFLICFMFSLSATAQASLGDSLLKVGSRGADVVELQTKLNQLGYSVGTVDGIFGNLTKQGVMNFQKVHSLVVDGIVGPNTVNSLNTAAAGLQGQQKINAILSTAKQYLGVKYQWGGSTPETGFDCSGFVAYVFKQNGISLPRVSRDQYTVGTKVSFDNLQPGDLVFFSFGGNGVVDHDGIYLGGGQFINASSSKGVTIYTIGPYWKSVYVGARRVI
ncbi:cell wall-associated hydrolase, invasion-associated protein [Desulfosporosinus orientis DSM 765]|uniref:Cell wall-associated hydrolase, invasion-associated protein n=1 Tax=Desulfosporosinus orientis (strain ATCC 19365 / DSM 765 / NCIMB 8382 / VKM B-1628 / Singapore I) TaxID=768706 RepID=G7WHL5_DESOD|nr:NlpC/P60 family protein [Desulfosporosinus orientis]AET70936.1 cell wall-associated hydrolase, invasion-associated protein [Desulfosporosinus orientis DSM 765]